MRQTEVSRRECAVTRREMLRDRVWRIGAVEQVGNVFATGGPKRYGRRAGMGAVAVVVGRASEAAARGAHGPAEPRGPACLAWKRCLIPVAATTCWLLVEGLSV
jgi:hypothetical protein